MELLEDIPVVPQKHTVFRVKCPKHIPEMPLTGDLTTGVYWRPEGKEYLAGSPISVFDADDLEPAWNDFEELIPQNRSKLVLDHLHQKLILVIRLDILFPQVANKLLW